MFDVIVALQKVLDRTAKSEIKNWFASLPQGAAWHVISDYVFGDPNRHDTAAFVLLLHHDKLETILGYIENQAPVDIKKSRTASEGLIRYLKSPVAYSFTFVLDDGDNFLSTYAGIPQIIEGLEDLIGVVDSMENNISPEANPYFSQVRKRLNAFIDDMKRKGNTKLGRQVFIVATFAAFVLDYLDFSAEPLQASWVSDRDAMLQRYDGVIWDIASIMFYVIKGHREATDGDDLGLISKPKLLHITPDASGPNHLDPLIRMADYLAAAGSDMNLNNGTFSHSKFETIGSKCFAESSNGVLCSLSWTGEGFRVRRISLPNA